MRTTLPLCLLAAACAQDATLSKRDDDPGLVAEDSDPAAGLDDSDEPLDTDDSAAPIDEDPVPAAAERVYAHTKAELYTVAPATGAVTLIGTMTEADGTKHDIVDVAIDLQGRLFAGSLGSATKPRGLFRVDPLTGQLSRVCDMAVALTAMTFTSDGRLVLGGDDVLQVVDVAAGCRVSTVFAADGYETSGDVVGLPDGLIYWTVRGALEDKLAVVDPDDASTARVVGGLGVDRLYGLGYDKVEGALYGFSSDGEIVRIEPKTAATQVLDEDAALKWWGATTNPVVWSN